MICYLDDILITGTNDEDHLSNLEVVLQHLQERGIRVKKEKCAFLQSSVEYLGHRIDEQGLHTAESKRRAIDRAPQPQNVQQLRSFLGLLNYYGKFIPNLSTIVQPLNQLDSILQGLTGVICYLDDILITGTNDEDHLSNLEVVLQRLQERGI